jgi:hypothetical protein
VTEPRFRLTIQTEEASLYSQPMPPMPVPRVGEDVFVPGDGMGWWRVMRVDWRLPSMRAMTPTMLEACYTVEWSPLNSAPAPTYDPDRGWAQ